MSNSGKTNGKVLMVEDETLLVQPLKAMLAEKGIELLHAKQGEEGLKMAKEHLPKLILLDIIMPIMDGYTMLKELRASDWGADIPVIILSNLTKEQEEQKFEDLRISGFLVKADISLREIVERIKQFV